ncbi:hypothetical protein F5884DRAFT_797590 [Xylogone sp. PMI_703]|nr:hypothetical protein F5884DRAFT_797590 [Xylogone sp. PMI_703]
MSKRTLFTTVTPLPPGISRAIVMDTLRSHTEMIDLNPLVEERHPCKPPPNCTAEEYHCVWYKITDKVQYLPGGAISGKVSYNAVFHDLPNGLQTHCYAPMGVDIKGKWTLGGTLPGEPAQPVELGLGVPMQGLYLREDVELKCNVIMTSFVKKTIKKAHEQLVSRLVRKAQLEQASSANSSFIGSPRPLSLSPAASHSSFATTMSAGPPPPSPFYQNQNQNHKYQEFLDSKDPSLYPRPLSSSSAAPSYAETMAQSSGSRWQQLDPSRPTSLYPPPLHHHPVFNQGAQYQNHSSSALPVELPHSGTPEPTTHYAELE